MTYKVKISFLTDSLGMTETLEAELLQVTNIYEAIEGYVNKHQEFLKAPGIKFTMHIAIEGEGEEGGGFKFRVNHAKVVQRNDSQTEKNIVCVYNFVKLCTDAEALALLKNGYNASELVSTEIRDWMDQVITIDLGYKEAD